MIGSWQQESVYVVTALAEVIAIRAMRGAFGPLAMAVRIYLGTQLAMFCLLMPLSLLEARYYLAAYSVASIINFIVELIVLVGLFEELSHDGRSYGTVRLWGMYCLLATLIAAGVVLIRPPEHLSMLARFYLCMDQVFTVFRNAGLFAVFFRGLLCGSAWPCRVSRVWLGLAIYSLLDFSSQRLELIHSFAFHDTIKYVPVLGLFVMLGLWVSALGMRTRAPGSCFPSPQEKFPV